MQYVWFNNGLLLRKRKLKSMVSTWSFPSVAWSIVIIVIVIWVLFMRRFRCVQAVSKRQAQACIWDHTVLSATCRLLSRRGNNLDPMQSSTAVIHHILAAPRLTYPEGMEGRVNSPAPGVETGPSRMRDGDLNQSATQTVKHACGLSWWSIFWRFLRMIKF
jgi:hypothetical protein